MKNILLFLSFIFLFAAANAQFIKKPLIEDLKKDQTLKQIIDNLPEGWEARTDSTALYFFRKEKVWVPRENLKKQLACETCKATLGDPKVFNFNMDKRMCYHVEVFFKIAVSNALNQEEIKKIKNNNIQLVAEVEKLKAKYKIDELIAKYNLDELSTSVSGMSKSEIKSRTKYLSELAKIGYKPVPDYISEKYLLYVVSTQGDPLNEKSDPPGVNNEFNAIRALLNGYCEVPN